METYPINKGIGRSVEFQGLKSQYLFIFAGQSMDLYRLRRDCRIHSGVADLLPEQEVRGTRADEAFRTAQPSPIPHQPTTHPQSVAAQGVAETKEKRE